MDDDTQNLLKTVCVAGGVRPAFDGNSNERLDQLVRAGLLEVVDILSEGPKRKGRRRYYRPTESGRALCRTLSVKGA
jgi:hypothetical protein